MRSFRVVVFLERGFGAFSLELWDLGGDYIHGYRTTEVYKTSESYLGLGGSSRRRVARTSIFRTLYTPSTFLRVILHQGPSDLLYSRTSRWYNYPLDFIATRREAHASFTRRVKT